MVIGWHVANPELIGGGRAARRFTSCGITINGGEHIARDQILAMPPRNRNALISSGYIEVYPMKPSSAERFLVSAGKGLYHVVEGQRVTSEPVSREQAETLAGGKQAA